MLPFTSETEIYVARGLHGVTGNVYLGLHEFEEMGFLLHFLRSADLFFDIGANVGTYTVLAAGHVGARCVACEPIPTTYKLLCRNVMLNELCDRVETKMVAIGETVGTVRMTTGMDAMNRVVDASELNGTCEVPVTSLDDLAANGSPKLVKIDVEGYEPAALKGASQFLSEESLAAIIIELGTDRIEESHRTLLEHEFEPYDYDPFSRTLVERKASLASGNVLYLRRQQIAEIRLRCQEAKSVHLHGLSV